MPAARDEARLVARARRGDKEAFADLYERYLEPIYHYVYIRVSHRQDAEDLTELVFLKAWENLERYRSDVPFRAWIYRIAHNTTIDYYRTRRASLPLNENLPQTSLGGDPAAAAQSEDLSRRLAGVLGQLPPDQQQVILLRFVSGLSCREVAEIMEREEGAVRVLQHRALKALRALLAVEEVVHA